MCRCKRSGVAPLALRWCGRAAGTGSAALVALLLPLALGVVRSSAYTTLSLAMPAITCRVTTARGCLARPQLTAAAAHSHRAGRQRACGGRASLVMRLMAAWVVVMRWIRSNSLKQSSRVRRAAGQRPRRA